MACPEKIGRLDARYDAVVIGAGNGGLAAALCLAVHGAKPLLLEQHNIPGGFATSFVRGRFEFDVSLHELSDVGPATNRGGVRHFLEDEAHVDVDWCAVPEAYRLIIPEDNLNVRVPFGVEAFIDAIAEQAPGSREPMQKYIELCQDISDMFEFLGSIGGKPDVGKLISDLIQSLRPKTSPTPKPTHDILSSGFRVSARNDKLSEWFSDLTTFLRNAEQPAAELRDRAVSLGNFLRTAGRTVEEVTRTFNLPDRALKIISPYWCYLGIPMSRLAFPIWASMLISYLTKGAYVPRLRSQELAMAMESRLRALGGHVEYNTRVERILTDRRGGVTGVETSAGDHIDTPCVISNASPTLVYSKLISPRERVPAAALRLANARAHGPSGFVVYMGLDAPVDQLGITDYGYFIADTMDTDAIYDTTVETGPTRMQATTCLNLTVPDCSPPGTTILCITILHKTEAWEDVPAAEYFHAKNRVAGALIDQFERATGVNVREHIEEIEIATPATFARYTKSHHGGIYGYEPDTWDYVIPRVLAMKDETYIRGLEFAGGYAYMGHGYSPSLLSGRDAALKVLHK